jgi:Ca-activated chloride channel family protein
MEVTMKTCYFYTLLAAYAFLAVNAFAFTVNPRRLAIGELTLHGTLNTTCVPTRGGTAYLHLDLRSEGFPQEERFSRRKNVAVVLDRSGSMADDGKLEQAKTAVLRLVDGLSSNDYLSIIVYDDRVQTLLPRQRVEDKDRIRRLVRGVSPGGSTNLGGGMVAGFRELSEFAGEDFVNRVILLSDGRANKGVTNLPELERIARSYRVRSVSLTAMGVGLDFNEDLMMGLAGAGGGNYYFIEDARELASIFERELGGIRTVAVQNAFIRLTPGRGVRVRDVIGYEWDDDGDAVVIPVGDLAANDRREIIVELDLPRGTGSIRAAAGTLRYAGCEEERLPSFSADIRYSDDLAEVRRGTNWEIQAKADVALSTRQVDRAMTTLKEGRPDEAAAQIAAARSALVNSPASVNAPVMARALSEQAQALTRFESAVRDSSADRNKVRKSVQFDNYKARKQKH